MNNAASNQDKTFRFRTRRGRCLADQIAEIEALATERLRAGVAYHSVHTGALALLKLELEGIDSALTGPTDGGMQIPACTHAPNQSRCAAPEG